MCIKINDVFFFLFIHIIFNIIIKTNKKLIIKWLLTDSPYENTHLHIHTKKMSKKS